MTLTRPIALALPLAALLAAGTASAQEVAAPGACACPAPAPVAVVVPAQGWDGVQRWGVGLRATALSLRVDGDAASETQYAGGGLQLRYRLAPHWELELSAEHVAEQLEDGTTGAELSSGTLSALYHMRPWSRWDWYLLAGIGGTSDGNRDLTPEERKATAQAHAHLGIGIERRFHHLGIAAELRAVGMAKPKQDQNDGAVPAAAVSAPSDPQKSGAQFNLAATWYF